MPEGSPAPTVSVVVSNHNYAAFVGAAVDSALGQTEPVEVVVVDDGSTDGSLEVLAGYGDRIRVVTQANAGQAAAVNAGVRAASGEWVMLLDADDLLDPGAAAALVARVARPDAVGASRAHYRLRCVDRSGDPLGFTNPPASTPLPEGDLVPELLLGGAYPTPVTSGTAYRRSALLEMGPIPEDRFRIAADGFLAVAAPFFGPVVTVHGSHGSYRLHQGNSWARSHIDGDRLAAMVAHDQDKAEVIAQMARRTGRDSAPPRPGHAQLRARLASLRVNGPDHPIPGDRTASLAIRAAASALTDRRLGARRRAALAAWAVVVWMAPRRWLSALVQRLYVPQKGAR
jgi:glycosyltransferase involved in cell wall biosynthesis